MGFILNRAIIDHGKHITIGTRDRYISRITEALLTNGKEKETREAIWKNIKKDPRKPRFAVTEDFVWSLFGRADETDPVDFEENPADVKTFCVWLQHNERLREWFNTCLADQDWHPQQIAITFSKNINPEIGRETSRAVMRDFYQKHQYELIQYAPIFYAEKVQEVLNALGADGTPTVEEADILVEALSHPAVYPFVDLTIEQLHLLLTYKDHDKRIEMCIASNPQWLNMLREVNWIDENTHQHITTATNILDTKKPKSLLTEDVTETQAYYLAMYHWKSISPKAQMGLFRFYFYKWFGAFDSSYKKSLEYLSTRSVVLGAMAEWANPYVKKCSESFNTFLLKAVEQESLGELKEDTRGLADVIMAIAEAEELATLYEKADKYTGHLGERPYNSLSDAAVIKNSRSRHSGPESKNSKEVRSTMQDSSSRSTSSSEDQKTPSPRKQHKLEAGRSPLALKIARTTDVRRRVERELAFKTDTHGIFADLESSWVEGEKVVVVKEEDYGSDVVAEGCEESEVQRELLKQLVMQGELNPFLERLFGDDTDSRKAHDRMIGCIEAAKRGKKTIESPFVLVLKEGEESTLALCREHIEKLNALITEDVVYEDIKKAGLLWKLFTLKLSTVVGESSSADIFFADGQQQRLYELLSQHGREIKRNILNNENKKTEAEVLIEQFKSVRIDVANKDNVDFYVQLLMCIYQLTLEKADSVEEIKSPLFESIINESEFRETLLYLVRYDASCELIDKVMVLNKDFGIGVINDVLLREDVDDQFNATMYQWQCLYQKPEVLGDKKAKDYVFKILSLGDEYTEKTQEFMRRHPAYLEKLLTSPEYRERLVRSEVRMEALGHILVDPSLQKTVVALGQDILKWFVEHRELLNKKQNVVGELLKSTVSEEEEFEQRYATVLNMLKDEDIRDAMRMQPAVAENLLTFRKQNVLTIEDIKWIINLRNNAILTEEVKQFLHTFKEACENNKELLSEVIGLANNSEDIRQYLFGLKDPIVCFVEEMDEEDARKVTDEDLVTMLSLPSISIFNALINNTFFVERIIRILSAQNRINLTAAQIYALFYQLAGGKAQVFLQAQNVEKLALNLQVKTVLFSDISKNARTIYNLWVKGFMLGDESQEVSKSSAYRRLFNSIESHNLWGLVQFCQRFHQDDNYTLFENFRIVVLTLIQDKLQELPAAIFAFINPEWVPFILRSLDPNQTATLFEKLPESRFAKFFDGEENAKNKALLKEFLDKHEDVAIQLDDLRRSLNNEKEECSI